MSNADQIEQLLIIISDVTEHLARARVEREQKELVAIFQRILLDRSGVEDFLAETTKLVRGLSEDTDPLVQRRLLHTLKGNAAMYELDSLAELAHAVENELTDNDAPLNSEQRRRLETAGHEAMARVESLLGGPHKDGVELERAELVALIERARGGAAVSELVRELVSWQREPVARRLEQLGQQAVGLARRLHKPEPQVRVQANGVRLDCSVWASYWAAMVHAVRNAVDHGLEDAATRLEHGKPPAGCLALGAARAGGRLTIWLEDDGRGIDWERVRERAARRGMPSERREDLIEALFTDGFSTRDAASDVSGRGVGLAALRQAVRDLSGVIRIDSTLGQGTKFSFSFEEPASMAEASEPHPASRVSSARSAG